MDHVIHHLSRSLLRSHGSTNEVHVNVLQHYSRIVLCAAVNPRVNLKLLVMVGQETVMVGQMPAHAHPWLRHWTSDGCLHTDHSSDDVMSNPPDSGTVDHRNSCKYYILLVGTGRLCRYNLKHNR